MLEFICPHLYFLMASFMLLAPGQHLNKILRYYQQDMWMLDILKILYTQKYYSHNTSFSTFLLLTFSPFINFVSFFLAILIYSDLPFSFFSFLYFIYPLLMLFSTITGYSQKSQMYCIIIIVNIFLLHFIIAYTSLL